MQLSFETVDVFTATRFGGNPLAVVFGAEGLGDAALQAIAREFHYSETTFVLPPADAAHTARVRIFSPRDEMAFAGHPNVGTATVLAWRGVVFGRPVGEHVLFEERAGLVPVRIERRAGAISGATFTAPQPLAVLDEAVPTGEVAACLGLAESAVCAAHHPPRVASAGAAYVLVELHDLASLARARPEPARFADQPAVAACGAVLAYVRTAGSPHELRARMFAPLRSVTEDAATGGACAALSGLLGSLAPGSGTLDLRITQGVEMGRPSVLRGAAEHAAGRVQAVRVGGDCVPVMRGTLLI